VSGSKFLAVDIGAESGRAFVGTFDGRRMHLEEIHRFPNAAVQVSGQSHWDIFGLFDHIKESLKLAVQKGHADIESVAVDTWGVDFGLLKARDNSMDLPFTYRDPRTNGMMEKVFGKIPSDEIYSRTGIQFMQINSLYQLYSMKEGCGSTFDDYDKLLFTPDIFNYFLTGERVSEYTIASTSQLLNAETKRFDEAIFSALGLPFRLMCPIVMPGTVVGKLLPAIGAEVGLKNVDVVAVGSHDTASAVAAVPAAGNEWAYLSSGTWSLLGIETDRPIINKMSRENNFTNEGGVGGKITFLQNIMGLWLLQELRRNWEKKNEAYSYDQLVSMARTAPEFKCVLDPADNSFLNPPDMNTAIMDFCRRTGQPFPETKGEMVRSIFESLALKYKSAVGKLGAITGRKIEALHVVGGGSRNEMLNQFTADAAGIPVIAGPVEATTLGNILVQAMAKGRIGSLEDGRRIVGESFQPKKFFPRDFGKWDEVYRSVAFDF
jgi:rhamnulokinase